MSVARAVDTDQAAVLSVTGLDVGYDVGERTLRALYEVDFRVEAGQIVGIVGESGCGKSSLAAALLRVLPSNGRILAGSIEFQGQDVLAMGDAELRRLRGAGMAMIYQDPQTTLNPVFTVGTQMVDALKAHTERARLPVTRRRTGPPGYDAAAARDRDAERSLRKRAVAALEQVGMPDAADRMDDYPHEFSGGQRQRIMIAISLLLAPRLLIADEPTSALDVTLEAQILELLTGLRDEHGTSIILVSHDLGVIAQVCDRVVVMYAGRCVEEADVHSLFANPRHPYTQALVASVPSRRRRGQRLAGIPGRVPSLAAMPSGCKFADRCHIPRPVCRESEPPVYRAGGDQVRCYASGPEADKHWSRDDRAGVFELLQAPSLEPPQGLTRVSDDDASDVLVRIDALETHFVDRAGPLSRLFGKDVSSVRAVDGVDLEIRRGEILGLVGESGSGKTTLGNTILRLVAGTKGDVFYDGIDTGALDRGEMRRLRRRMQMIFQEPHASLSPRKKVEQLLLEPYKIHSVPVEQQYSVSDLLEFVRLPAEVVRKFPYQLSGGQARRVGIARALALRPEFIVADEPTSGLDVSAAASILNLIKDLGGQFGLTYLLITHNLNTVGFIADRIAVMYLGQLVEVGPTQGVFASPSHPYTRALLSSVSEPDPSKRLARRILLPGEIPSPKNPPSGCRFHTRCTFAQERCRKEVPALEERKPEMQVACHFWRDVVSSGWNADTASPL
jgi:peptide/nickel transport system ATP-binding protein